MMCEVAYFIYLLIIRVVPVVVVFVMLCYERDAN